MDANLNILNVFLFVVVLLWGYSFSISNILILGFLKVLPMVEDICLIYGFPYRNKIDAGSGLADALNTLVWVKRTHQKNGIALAQIKRFSEFQWRNRRLTFE